MGVGWRAELTPFLDELGFEVLDPSVFEAKQLKGLRPGRLPDYCTNLEGKRIRVKHWHDLKNASEQHLYARFQKYMGRVIKYDIRIVRNESDNVIVFWDDATARGAGTHAEITEAFLKGIPVYCVAKADMPAWAKGCCSAIFLNFDALKDFLKDEFGD
jgi:hypothetical protein